MTRESKRRLGFTGLSVALLNVDETPLPNDRVNFSDPTEVSGSAGWSHDCASFGTFSRCALFTSDPQATYTVAADYEFSG
jgi:hypothetical protein